MKRYVFNGAWMMVDGFGGSLLALVTMAIVARWLGPEDFGSYSYIFSLAALFGILGHMGLDGILMRELVNRPSEEPAVLGTVFGIKLSGFILGALAMVVYGFAVPAHSVNERWLFVLGAVSVLAGAVSSVVVNWFRARVEARQAAIANFTTILSGGVAKIALVIAGAGVVAVGAAQAVSVLIGSGVMLWLFRVRGGTALSGWRFEPTRARSLFGESWQLFFGAMLASVYINIDITMVRLLLGSAAAGQYAVPSRFIQTAQLVAIAISTTIFPLLIAAHRDNPAMFDKAMRLGFCAMVLPAYLLIAASLCFGEAVLVRIFGSGWTGAGTILTLLSLTLPLAFCRFLTTRWIILERRGGYQLWSEATGASLNIALNFWLIPRFGPAGAAISTLVAYLVATLLSLLVIPDGRRIFVMIIMALFNPITPLLAYRHERRQI